MNESFDFPSTDAVAIGAVGEPGQRVFLLQARAGVSRLTLKIEKQQAAAIAEAVSEVLADLPDQDIAMDATLQEPFEPDWVVGALGLTPLDEATGHITIVAKEFVRDEESEALAATANIGLTPGQLAALGRRAAELVAGGRPACELCGFPVDPSGHSCPKTNGHLKH